MDNKFFFGVVKCCSLFSLLFLMACQGDVEEKKKEEQKSFQQETAEQLSQKVNLSKTRRVELTTEAKNATENWSAYLTLKSEIEGFENSTYQQVINGSNNLVESLISFKTSLPEVFQEIPVQSRIKVLVTQAQVLQQDVENPRVKPAHIDTLVNKIYKSFGDLKIQLNEVFLKTLEDLESEFDAAIQP